MRSHNRPEETRLYSHGQGYDMVERPLIRKDETMRIQANMNIVVHPTYMKDGGLHWLCDNYIVGADGARERLHHFPEEIHGNRVTNTPLQNEKLLIVINWDDGTRSLV